MFIKITSGQPNQFPYTVGQLRRDNPQTSFPKNIPVETLEEYGVFPVTEVVPVFDSTLHYITRNTYAHKDTDSGTWVVGFTVHNIPLEHTEEKIRKRIRKLLAETDWLVTRSIDAPDKPVSQEMKEYRQALRDIPQQDGFPYEITWPTKPE